MITDVSNGVDVFYIRWHETYDKPVTEITTYNLIRAVKIYYREMADAMEYDLSKPPDANMRKLAAEYIDELKRRGINNMYDERSVMAAQVRRRIKTEIREVFDVANDEISKFTNLGGTNYNYSFTVKGEKYAIHQSLESSVLDY
jgi:hypothetical protein